MFPRTLFILCFFFLSCSKPLDVVAIDHLPSVLPRESSEKFANKMTPYLMKLVEVRRTRTCKNEFSLVVFFRTIISDTLLKCTYLSKFAPTKHELISNLMIVCRCADEIIKTNYTVVDPTELRRGSVLFYLPCWLFFLLSFLLFYPK